MNQALYLILFLFPLNNSHCQSLPEKLTIIPKMPTTKPPRDEQHSQVYSDIILPMQDPYMTQIINGSKNYEFRKYRLKPSVQRIWFYRTAPHSSITHICETLPAQTRNNLLDRPLDEDGLGNAEFNNRHPDWEGYDFAYKMVSVYALRKAISLREMRESFGFRAAPRGPVYLPRSIARSVDWREQELVC